MGGVALEQTVLARQLEDRAEHLQVAVYGLGRQPGVNPRCLEAFHVAHFDFGEVAVGPRAEVVEEQADGRGVGNPRVLAKVAVRFLVREPLRKPCPHRNRAGTAARRALHRVVEQFPDTGFGQTASGGVPLRPFQV